MLSTEAYENLRKMQRSEKHKRNYIKITVLLMLHLGEDGVEYFNFAENAHNNAQDGTNKKLNKLYIKNGALVGVSSFKEEYDINRVTIVQPNKKNDD
ncbi:MAG: hypothetical protein NW226_19120 [Microscillaceae bacterium]|nr:hypothetical protein [Microscillaceae bacterium]